MKLKTKKQIIEILNRCVEGSLHRVGKDKTHRPFHEALLTRKLVAASAFERSFSTSFGQGPIEEISKILALDSGAECERQYEIQVNVNKGAIDEIGKILVALRSGEAKPNWIRELSKIGAHKKGDHVVQKVISDLWIKRGNEQSFISIKTVKPNLDQTEIVKKTMLLLKGHDSEFKTYLGLYYNPGGDNRQDYNWSMPSKIFDMQNDECVLIGSDYWLTVAGEYIYDELLEIFKSVGDKTRKKLELIGQ